MPNKRLLIFYVILTVLAATLQIVPRVLGDVFVFAAVLGGFPIFTAARISWAWGVIVYMAAAFLSSIMDMGEALFFICTNGIIGLSLGIMQDRQKNIYIRPIPSAVIVIIMLSAVNNLFGISIFGYSRQINLLLQALMLFIPLYIYCLFYMRLAMSADNLLHRRIELDIH